MSDDRNIATKDRNAAASVLAAKERDALSRERIRTALASSRLSAAEDGSEMEARLTAQAAALDVMFSELADRGTRYIGEYLPGAEIYLRLALKAQAQCRATASTLADIKNPRPVAFLNQTNVAQTNVSHGPQQVNNGIDPDD